jgi:hypothetical protein
MRTLPSLELYHSTRPDLVQHPETALAAPDGILEFELVDETTVTTAVEAA